MEYTNCNLCNADNTETLYIHTELRNSTPPGCKLVRCSHCGLIYLNPRPSQDELTSYYPDDYQCYRPAIEEETFPVMKWMRKRKLAKRRKLIEKFSQRKHGRILDVGCSTGLFLHEMELAGWETFGVEPNLSASQYAHKYFGLNVISGTLLESQYPSQSFDVISFWDVLEHTASPSLELRRSAELLKPGGMIAINVPNYNSPEREYFGQFWNGYDPPRHLYVFTQETLTKLLEQNGFESLNWVCFMSSYFSFGLSLNRWLSDKSPNLAMLIKRILDFPGVRFIFEPYLAILNWQKRGSIIAVFAQKKVTE